MYFINSEESFANLLFVCLIVCLSQMWMNAGSFQVYAVKEDV